MSPSNRAGPLIVVAAAVLATGSASAQSQVGTGATTDGTPVYVDTSNEVVVTGSRIARPNLVSPVPVVRLNAVDLEQTGLQSTAEILNQLPQTSNSQTAENSNRFVNGAGLQAINLRGLGAYRTLTLVDGRRHIGSLSGVNNSGGTSEVDTAVIAPALIDHIDVVTGGSSAAYGADAVAGVVNFILKKNYQGAEATVEEGGATEGGKSTFSVDAIFGGNFANDRGNITVATDFQNQADIRASQRSYELNDVRYEPNPAASGQPAFITYEGVRSSRNAGNYAATLGSSIAGNKPYTFVFNPNGSGLSLFNRGNLIPTNPNFSYGNTGDGYNTPSLFNGQAPNNRKILNALINYKVAEDVGPFNDINFFADLKYADSSGGPYANGTTTAITGTDANIPIPVSNVFIPSDLRKLLTGYTKSVTGGIPDVLQSGLSSGFAGPTFNIRKTTADWGLRTSQYEYEYYRSVIGFNGTVFNKFKYEVYYNYGQNHTTFDNSDRITANLLNALDAVPNPLGGAPICASSIAAPDNGCVPINPFRVGALTTAQNNYINTILHEHDLLQQQNVVGNISGDIFSFATPFSGTVAPVGLALGLEYREEHTDSHSDPLALQPTGTIGGNQVGTGPTIGGFHTNEAYSEISIPILRDLPLFKAVDFDGAFRYQSYSTTGDDFTWNARATWALTDDFKFRGGFAKAVRSPNEDELYSPFAQSFTSFQDPCGGENGANRTNAQRKLACSGGIPGIPAVALYTNSPYSSSQLIGGNRGLKVETSQNAQFGGVFTPRFLPGFTASVDYYSFIIKNVITTVDPNSELASIYDGGSSQYLPLINRNPDGSLNTVTTPLLNAGRQVLKGLDFSVGYLIPMSDYGLSFVKGNDSVLNLTFDASWLQNNKIQVPISGVTNRLIGQLGFPRVKFIVKGTYTEGPVSFNATTRYYGEQNINVVDDNTTFDHNLIAPQVYEDIYVAYNWRQFKFFAGVQNILDIRPSSLPTVVNGGSYPDANSNGVVSPQASGVIDNTGRYVFAGLTAKF